jgi:4-hydroxy-tetrahydrodipicolinate synthase
MASPLVTGSGIALVTPFGPTLGIDWPGFERLLTHTGRAADFAVLAGTTGESATLSHTEKAELVQAVRHHAAWAGKPIVLGLGGNDTRALLEEIARTDFAAITAILSVTPYYSRPSTAGMVAHFTALADACPVPVILYNVPSRTGVNLGTEAVTILSQHPNIAGLKEASADLMQWQHQRLGVRQGFALLAGDDGLAPAMLALGACGVIGVMGNALPGLFGQMIDEALAGNLDAASRLHARYLVPNLNDMLYAEGNPVGVKAALEALGICSARVRPPLAEASTTLKNTLARMLQEVNG